MGLFFKALFRKWNRGATLIEMAIVIGLIAMVAIPAIRSLGDELSKIFQGIESGLDDMGGGESHGAPGNEGGSSQGENTTSTEEDEDNVDSTESENETPPVKYLLHGGAEKAMLAATNLEDLEASAELRTAAANWVIQQAQSQPWYAIEYLQKAAELNPSTITAELRTAVADSLMAEAMQAIEWGDPSWAAKLLQEAIELDPSRAVELRAAVVNSLKAIAENEDYDPSYRADYLLKAIELNPEADVTAVRVAVVNSLMAIAEDEDGGWDPSYKADLLLKALKLDPEAVPAELRTAVADSLMATADQYYNEWNDTWGAADLLLKALKLDPEQTLDAWAEAGELRAALAGSLMAMAESEDYDPSYRADCLQKAIELDPEQAPAELRAAVAGSLLTQAEHFMDDNNLQEAADCLLKAAELDPEAMSEKLRTQIADLLMTQAEQCMDDNNLQEAADCLLKAAELGSEENTTGLRAEIAGLLMQEAEQCKNDDPQRSAELVLKASDLQKTLGDFDAPKALRQYAADELTETANARKDAGEHYQGENSWQAGNLLAEGAFYLGIAADLQERSGNSEAAGALRAEEVGLLLKAAEKSKGNAGMRDYLLQAANLDLDAAPGLRTEVVNALIAGAERSDMFSYYAAPLLLKAIELDPQQVAGVDLAGLMIATAANQQSSSADLTVNLMLKVAELYPDVNAADVLLKEAKNMMDHNPDRAAYLLSHAIDLNLGEEVGEMLRNAYLELHENDNTPQAAEFLRQAMELNPGTTMAEWLLKETEKLHDDGVGSLYAAKYMLKAIELNPETVTAELRKALADSLIAEAGHDNYNDGYGYGDGITTYTQAAAECLQKAMELNPELTIDLLITEAERVKEDYPKYAAELLLRTTKLDPTADVGTLRQQVAGSLIAIADGESEDLLYKADMLLKAAELDPLQGADLWLQMAKDLEKTAESWELSFIRWAEENPDNTGASPGEETADMLLKAADLQTKLGNTAAAEMLRNRAKGFSGWYNYHY